MTTIFIVLAILVFAGGIGLGLTKLKSRLKKLPDIDPNAPRVPTPVTGETAQKFIQRCVSDEYMKRLYPTDSARLNMCDVIWKESNT